MDLKIKEVAELLQLTEATIRRLVNEGKIPAYRLNREYRFNRAEIEDWLMRTKLAAKEEKVIASESHSGTRQFSLFRALHRGGVLLVGGESKEEIVKVAMENMGQRFDLDSEVLIELFMEREKMMPTSLGHGIAVPHTRDFLLSTHYDVVLLAFPDKPIEWGALDGIPIHTLFFLFASDDKNHLHLLAKLAYFSSNEERRAFLASRPKKEELLEYIKDWESTLTV